MRESDGQNLFHRHSAVGELLGQNELLRVGQAGRYHHFPTGFQLVDERRRNEIGSGRHDHLDRAGDRLLARFSYDRATRLLDVGLDSCCERSVAGEAGGAVAAPEDRTPRVADLGGVEVVRR